MKRTHPNKLLIPKLEPYETPSVRTTVGEALKVNMLRQSTFANHSYIKREPDWCHDAYFDVDANGHMHQLNTYVYNQPQFCERIEQDFFDTPINIKNRRKLEKKERRVCPHCGLDVKISVFYHHRRQHRLNGYCMAFMPLRFPCPECKKKFGSLELVCNHLEQFHGKTQYAVKTAVLRSEEEFREFKANLEGKGGNLRMTRGTKKNTTGYSTYFRCNRQKSIPKSKVVRFCDQMQKKRFDDEKYSSSDTSVEDKKALVAKTKVRTEDVCTAFLVKMTKSDGKIHVRYCDHHIHADEKLHIPSVVRRRIIEMNEKGLPLLVIMMVLKAENKQLALTDDANYRRTQSITSTDVKHVINSHQRTGKKKKYNVKEEVKKKEEFLEADLNDEESKCLEEYRNNQGDIIAEISIHDKKMQFIRDAQQEVRESFHSIRQFLQKDELKKAQFKSPHAVKLPKLLKSLSEQMKKVLKIKADEKTKNFSKKDSSSKLTIDKMEEPFRSHRFAYFRHLDNRNLFEGKLL